MPVTLYGHRLSQPCRAAEILLRELDVSYVWHEIDFAGGATREPWFADRINLLHTIPALALGTPENSDDEPGMVIGESHAILRYLCRTAAVQATARQWYPSDHDVLRSARIDQWMAWHHNNIRAYDMFHDVMNVHLTLPMLKREIQSSQLKPLQNGLNPGLALLERHFEQQTEPRQSHPTLCGDEYPTLADLAMTCELFQIRAVGYRFTRYPLVSKWLDGMAQRPHFTDVSEEVVEQGQTIREQNGAYLDLEHAFA